MNFTPDQQDAIRELIEHDGHSIPIIVRQYRVVFGERIHYNWLALAYFESVQRQFNNRNRRSK